MIGPPQQRIALTAGVVVVLAYLLGSIPFGYLLTKRRLRQSLRRLDDGGQPLEQRLAELLAGGSASRRDEILAAVLDTAKVLLAATLAWHVVAGVAPPFHRAQLPRLSAVGFLSDQVLTIWQSAALWSGAAALVGHLRPLWLRVRGGQAPALGLVFVYSPQGFAVGVAGFFLAYLATRRIGTSVLLSLPAFMAFEWLAWVFDLPAGPGTLHGPELALWAAALSGIVAVRTRATGEVAP